jgi:stage V sporulation protein B
MVTALKNRLLKGTIILTAAGILTRLIGFGYRIFLSGTLGETKLGIYQLIFPVYSLAFTIYGAGIQTAVSQMISHEPSEKHIRIVKSGIFLSLCSALALSVLLYMYAVPVSIYFLDVPETAPLLRILALLFPFCGVTAVINGYFYGINSAKIPAISQIVEQLFRVGFIVILYFSLLQQTMNTAIAVAGLVAGEIASHIYNVFYLSKRIPLTRILHEKMELKKLVSLSLPLSSNKLIVALLGSIESILIPAMLIRAGYSNSDALGIYGIFTGVVLPFILFPGTLTNSLSVLLLPQISHAYGSSELWRVKKTATVSCHYSLLLGVLTSSLLLNYGISVGNYIFHSENAGKLLTLSAFLCPFIYVTTTLSSVINGLGKTGITFFNTIVGLSIRILFLIFMTPQYGIYGYLFGMLLSQIIICVLNAIYLIKMIKIRFSLMKYLVWPSIFCSSMFYIAKTAGNRLADTTENSSFVLVFLIPAAFLILLYFYKFRLIKKSDFL